MYRRATDLIRSSSSGEDGNGKKRKRFFIVFADVHHADTQINAANKSNIESANDVDGSSITTNDENDARLRKGR